MSILAPLQDEWFKIHTFKYVADAPNMLWANTYDVFCDTPTATFDDLTAAADKIVAFEQQLHGTNIGFNKVVISTWVPDGTPYNPTSFVSQSLDLFGLAVISGGYLDTRIVWNVKKEVATGKTGRIAFRGCITEGDIKADTGFMSFENASNMGARLSTAISTSHLSDLWSDEKIFAMGMMNKEETYSRNVTGLSVGMPSVHSRTRKRLRKP